MKRLAIYLVTAVFFLIINSTIAAALLPVGIFPDFLLILVFNLALRSKSSASIDRRQGVEGVIASFILGLIADIFSGSIIGTTSFGLVCIYVFTHLLSGKMLFDSPLVKIGGVFIMTLTKAGLVYMILRIMLFDSSISFYIYAVPSAIITAGVSPLLFNILDRVDRFASRRHVLS